MHVTAELTLCVVFTQTELASIEHLKLLTNKFDIQFW